MIIKRDFILLLLGFFSVYSVAFFIFFVRPNSGISENKINEMIESKIGQFEDRFQTGQRSDDAINNQLKKISYIIEQLSSKTKPQSDQKLTEKIADVTNSLQNLQTQFNSDISLLKSSFEAAIKDRINTAPIKNDVKNALTSIANDESATVLNLKPFINYAIRLGLDDKRMPKHQSVRVPAAIRAEIERVAGSLPSSLSKLKTMFRNCFVSTINTTTQLAPDGTTHVFTGDIPALWLRDSSAQVHHYLPLASKDLHLQVILEGLVTRQAQFVILDPYANAFRFEDEPNVPITPHEKNDGKTTKIWERKYEVDSLAYFLSLSYKYWKSVGTTICKSSGVYTKDDLWINAVEVVVDVWIKEQNHDPQTSPYKYHSEMPLGGRANPTKFTGMTWSGFRPSDDACKYNYLVPSNMFAVVTLKQMEEMIPKFYDDKQDLLKKIVKLYKEIDDGIHKYAIVEADGLKIYAYETDGLGNYNLMDDANVPSLLSIPYLNYTSEKDPSGAITANTRRWVLSKSNPFYYEGSKARGIGSPHTYHGYIWPIALTMQALTTNDEDEILRMIESCIVTDAGTNLMHESFDPNNPSRFSRPWFAWANSLFGEMIVKHRKLINSKWQGKSF